MSQSKYDEIFPTRMRKLIEEKNVTQNAIATEIGVSRQAISQYADGSSVPNADKLVKLAQFFEVSADYLLGLTDAKTNDKDAQAVCDYTGLSSTALQNLHDEHELSEQCGYRSKTIAALNVLLESTKPATREGVLFSFDNYINVTNMFVPDEQGERDFFAAFGNNAITPEENRNLWENIFANKRKGFYAFERKKDGISASFQFIDDDFWENYFMNAIQKSLFKLKETLKNQK